jgi:hypothetical protein
VSGTSSGGELVGVVVGKADVSEFMQSRKFGLCGSQRLEGCGEVGEFGVELGFQVAQLGDGELGEVDCNCVSTAPIRIACETYFARPVVAVVTPCLECTGARSGGC